MSMILLGGAGAALLVGVGCVVKARHGLRDRVRARAEARVTDLMRLTWVWLGGERGVGFNAYQDRLRRVTAVDGLAPESVAGFRDLGRRAGDDLAGLDRLPPHLDTLRAGLEALHVLAQEQALDPMAVSRQLDDALEALLPLLSGTGGDVDLYEEERDRPLDSAIGRQDERLGRVVVAATNR